MPLRRLGEDRLGTDHQCPGSDQHLRASGELRLRGQPLGRLLERSRGGFEFFDQLLCVVWLSIDHIGASTIDLLWIVAVVGGCVVRQGIPGDPRPLIGGDDLRLLRKGFDLGFRFGQALGLRKSLLVDQRVGVLIRRNLQATHLRVRDVASKGDVKRLQRVADFTPYRDIADELFDTLTDGFDLRAAARLLDFEPGFDEADLAFCVLFAGERDLRDRVGELAEPGPKRVDPRRSACETLGVPIALFDQAGLEHVPISVAAHKPPRQIACKRAHEQHEQRPEPPDLDFDFDLQLTVLLGFRIEDERRRVGAVAMGFDRYVRRGQALRELRRIVILRESERDRCAPAVAGTGDATQGVAIRVADLLETPMTDGELVPQMNVPNQQPRVTCSVTSSGSTAGGQRVLRPQPAPSAPECGGSGGSQQARL